MNMYTYIHTYIYIAEFVTHEYDDLTEGSRRIDLLNSKLMDIYIYIHTYMYTYIVEFVTHEYAG